MPLGRERGRRRGPQVPAWARLALVVLVVGSGAVAAAEPADPKPLAGVPTSPSPSAAPADAAADAPPERAPGEGAHVVWIRPEEVAVRADGLLRGLEGTAPGAAVRAAVARVEQDLGALAPDLEGLIQNTRVAVARSTPFVELDDLRRELAAADATLGGWEATLVAEAKRVSEALDDIMRARVMWLETRARPETVAAGAAVARRVGEALAALDEAAATFQPWRNQVLAISDRVLDRRAAVARALKRVQEAAATEWMNLFVPGRPPLWQGGFASQLRSELPRVPAQIVAYGRGTFAYVARDVRPLGLQILVAAILMAVFRRSAARAGTGPAERAAPPRRPYALAWLLALLATPWLHPLSPQRFRQLMAIGALIPASRLTLSTSGPVGVAELASLFVLLFFDRLTLALAPLPAAARASALLTAVLGLVLASQLARRVPSHGGPSRSGRLAHLVLGALAVALAAEIGGWDHLAAFLGRGIIAGAVIAVFVYAAVIGLEPLVVDALESPLVQQSRMLTSNPSALRRRVRSVLRGLGALLWLGLVLRAVGLHAAAVAGLQAVLAAGVSVGALSISVGTVLAFVLTLVAAMLLARTATGVLEADVYPRASLPRGVPVVLSTLVRYAVYSLGFLCALAAAGIELSQLTILLGGLGVGIGLGLQRVAANYISGITILLDRSVSLGDVVTVDGFHGEVTKMTSRCIIVRGTDGTNGIIPNETLITSKVINHSYFRGRALLRLPVQVAYGTDLETALRLLLEAATAHANVLGDPAPAAVVNAFADSGINLELQAWAENPQQKLAVQTELHLAMYRSFAANGIEIPFPQRDIRIVNETKVFPPGLYKD